MRTTFTLLFSLLLLSGAYAAERFHPGMASQLQLRVPGHGNYVLHVGPRTYRMHQGLVRINYLPSGRHNIRVMQEIWNPRAGFSRNQLVFRGQLSVPPGSRMFVRILPNGRMMVDRVERVNSYGRRGYHAPAPNHRQQQFGWDDDGWDDWYDQDNYSRGRGQHQGYYHFNNNQDGFFEDDWGYHQNQTGAFNSLDNSRFMLFLNGLTQESFDDTKLEMAQSFMAQNPLSSAQVVQVLTQLNFESSKLRFAKAAYLSVLDPENYFMVAQSFSFSSSRQDLSRYMAHSMRL